MSDPPALLYLVRPGEQNDELRWSLRTCAANLPHSEVWTVGHQPSWLTGVRHLPGNTGGSKQRNVYGNLRIACEHPDLPAEVIVMNDDFFILRPTTCIPMTYRGTLAAHLASLGQRRDWWQRSMRATMLWLRYKGFTDPLSYELHRPFPILSEQMAVVLAEAADFQPHNPPQWRTLYGNRWAVPGIEAEDVKFTRAGGLPAGTSIFSTTDSSWNRSMAARRIRLAFPEPSPYERRT